MTKKEINKRNIRRDIVTKEKFNKEKLLRIVVTKKNKTFIDKDFNIEGRGIYIHKNNILKGLEKGIIEKNVKKYNGSFKEIEDELKKFV